MAPTPAIHLPIRAQRKPSWKYQAWCTVASDLAPLCYGMALGFTGICIPHLRQDTIIELTEDDESWMASLFGAGGVTGAVLMAPMADALGRRKSLLISSALFLIGWVIATASLNLASLQTSRFILGMGAGCQAGTQLAYVSELSEIRLRAILTCSAVVGQFLGVSIVFLLGLLLSWRIVAGLSSVPPMALMVLIFVIPDSPASLLSRGLYKEAEDAFRKFRGQYYDRRSMQEEVEALERSQTRFPGPTTIHWKSSKHLVHLKSWPVVKSLLILATFSFVCEFAGAAVIVAYATDIFHSFGGALDKYTATLVAGLVQLALSALGLLLVHFLPRRFLAVTSGVGMALTLGSMSAFLYTNGSPENPIFVVGLWFYLLFLTPGFLMLHLLLRAELFPLRIRATGATVVAAMDFLFVFISLYLYSSMKAIMGTAGILCVFAIVSLFGAMFSYFMVPETMGKSLSEIEEGLLGKNRSDESGGILQRPSTPVDANDYSTGPAQHPPIPPSPASIPSCPPPSIPPSPASIPSYPPPSIPSSPSPPPLPPKPSRFIRPIRTMSESSSIPEEENADEDAGGMSESSA